MNNSNSQMAMFMVKLYFFLGMMWNFTIMIYYIVLINKNRKNNEKKFDKKIITLYFCIIILVITLVLSIPAGWEKNEIGFWIYNGPLNLLYNRMFIICDGLLLGYILLNRKKLSKDLVIYSLIIYSLFISNYILEGIFGYYAKDTVFMYSLFVSAMYYTTESQDKQTSEAYEEARKQSIEIDKQKTNFLLFRR